LRCRQRFTDLFDLGLSNGVELSCQFNIQRPDRSAIPAAAMVSSSEVLAARIVR
jgi:hypothetical protein